VGGSLMLSATLQLQSAELQQLIETLDDPKVKRTLMSAARAVVASMVRYTIRSKLRGQVLNRVTGTLIRDVTASPTVEPVAESGGRITGAWGTSLGYGRAHEEGFQGTVNVRAHHRRLRLRTKSGRKRTEKTRLRDALRGKRTSARVRAHTRQVDIRAKWYLRDSLREKESKIDSAVRKALLILLVTGEAATVEQMGDPLR
jgi:hypothetical protein